MIRTLPWHAPATDRTDAEEAAADALADAAHRALTSVTGKEIFESDVLDVVGHVEGLRPGLEKLVLDGGPSTPWETLGTAYRDAWEAFAAAYGRLLAVHVDDELVAEAALERLEDAA